MEARRGRVVLGLVLSLHVTWPQLRLRGVERVTEALLTPSILGEDGRLVVRGWSVGGGSLGQQV